MSLNISGKVIKIAVSLIMFLLGTLFYDFAIETLSPLGLRNLAISTWILLLISMILLALVLSYRLDEIDLKRQIQTISAAKDLQVDQLKSDLVAYNPKHFEDKEFEKYFNEFAHELNKKE
jgi:hypothetical protein